MRVGSRWLSVGGLLLIMLMVGTAAAQDGGEPERGGELFARYCMACHGEDGRGRVGAGLDSFPGIQADAALEQVITQGVEGSVMPAWGKAYGGPLLNQDVADIAAYITSVLEGTQPVIPAPTYQAPDIPPLPNVEGDPSTGAMVFQTNCSGCHGEQAQGGFGWPLAKPWPGNQPQVYLRQVISTGIEGTIMPGWARDRDGPLSDAEIGDLTAYVLSLSPAAVQTTPVPQPEGPLSQTISLVIFGALAVTVIIGLVVYYRRA